MVPNAVPFSIVNAAKIVARMRNNPRDWRIEDLKVVALHHGITWRQHSTNHVVFVAQHSSLPVPADRPIKPVYVKLFLKLLED
jgi:hypothetical protein